MCTYLYTLSETNKYTVISIATMQQLQQLLGIAIINVKLDLNVASVHVHCMLMFSYVSDSSLHVAYTGS